MGCRFLEAVKRMRRRFRLTCQQLVELVTDYLEDALSRRDRARFERHVSGCGACPAYLDQMRQTLTLGDEFRAFLADLVQRRRIV
jgi:anti-sigma factor RsiW